MPTVTRRETQDIHRQERRKAATSASLTLGGSPTGPQTKTEACGGQRGPAPSVHHPSECITDGHRNNRRRRRHRRRHHRRHHHHQQRWRWAFLASSPAANPRLSTNASANIPTPENRSQTAGTPAGHHLSTTTNKQRDTAQSSRVGTESEQRANRIRQRKPHKQCIATFSGLMCPTSANDDTLWCAVEVALQVKFAATVGQRME